jgi:hypothetical protein
VSRPLETIGIPGPARTETTDTIKQARFRLHVPSNNSVETTEHVYFPSYGNFTMSDTDSGGSFDSLPRARPTDDPECCAAGLQSLTGFMDDPFAPTVDKPRPSPSPIPMLVKMVDPIWGAFFATCLRRRLLHLPLLHLHCGCIHRQLPQGRILFGVYPNGCVLPPML